MKNLEEIAKKLEIEIKNKKKDLAIIKTDLIMSNLKPTDVRIAIVENSTTKKLYFQAKPKVPYRSEGCTRLMTKSLGSITKNAKPEIFIQKRDEAIKLFKKKWLDMRNDFEILKNNS